MRLLRPAVAIDARRRSPACPLPAPLPASPTLPLLRAVLTLAPSPQADDAAAAAELKKKRTFKKFTFRGIDLESLLDLTPEQLMDLVHARARRRFTRGLKRKHRALIKKLKRAKKDVGPYDKPDVVKTHLRDMIIVPDMIGSIVGVHNGKVFTAVEVKAEMVGHYLGEFSITYKPVRHGRPGIGATSSSKFIPLK